MSIYSISKNLQHMISNDCFEQGLNLSSLQSSRYIKRCVSVHSQ